MKLEGISPNAVIRKIRILVIIVILITPVSLRNYFGKENNIGTGITVVIIGKIGKNAQNPFLYEIRILLNLT